MIIISRLCAPKSILETEKTQKPQKTHWAGFLKKPGFFQPCLRGQAEVRRAAEDANKGDGKGESHRRRWAAVAVADQGGNDDGEADERPDESTNCRRPQADWYRSLIL